MYQDAGRGNRTQLNQGENAKVMVFGKESNLLPGDRTVQAGSSRTHPSGL